MPKAAPISLKSGFMMLAQWLALLSQLSSAACGVFWPKEMFSPMRCQA